MMTMMTRLSMLLLICICLTVFPTSVLAASFELTPTAKNNFDKIVSSTTSAKATTLNTRYSNVLELQQQSIDWDKKIKDLHYTNEETVIVLKKQIQRIDEDKINKLQTQVTQTKERYKTLFSAYEALNLQKAAAKKLTNKELYKLLQSQSETMEIAVQLARADIRNKTDQLTSAKMVTASTKKTLRGKLDEITPLKVQIKAAKSSASSYQKKFTAETSTLKKSIKDGSVDPTLSSLGLLVTHIQRVIEYKQNVWTIEQKIAAITQKVKVQIPS
ncbi:hypothetical protein [Paenibacillus crassostreae]|nr:hypothetical protein [Paenibacillus crassostreae]